MTDPELLQLYADTGSHEAFAGLVAHHCDWIYSAALRMVRRRDWAEDVTQAVFLVLALRAGELEPSTLNRWLFKVTRYCASNILRKENRREKRERRAAVMNSRTPRANWDSEWEDIAPLLEPAVERLRDRDREAILLRFYQQKSMLDVGHALGISEDAAQKRVAKALEQLRSWMSGHGVLLPATGAAITLLSERTTHAAPLGLGTACLPGSATATAAAIARGVHQLLFALKLKTMALGIVAIALIPLGFWIILHASAAGPPVVPAAPVLAAPLPAAAAQRGPAIADDAAITPFYNSLTQIIISINFAQIDLDALAAEQQKLLNAAIGPNDPRRASVDQAVAESHAMLMEAGRATSAAGAGHLYPMVAQLSATDIAGFFVLPTGRNSNVAGVDQLMKKYFVDQPVANSPDGMARMYGDKRHPLLSRMLAGQARPEFTDAMAAGPDGAIRMVILPGFFREIADDPPTAQTLGLADISEAQWAGVKWCRLTIIAPPKLSATLVFQCLDAESAGTLAKLFTARFTALHENPPANEFGAQVAKLIDGIQPAVSGSTVTLNLDQKIMEPILTEWYLSEMLPPPAPTSSQAIR